MIAFTDISKRYGRRQVLDHFTATVPTGLVTVLVGPNGSGKTTLLKLLLGLARADGGRIVIDDVPLDGNPASRARIGYMPQTPRFPSRQSGRELLRLLQHLRRDTAEPELSLADAFAMRHQFDRPLGELSGGWRQRINAVLALAFRPALLVLDEPTAGLDPLAGRIFKDRLLAERAAGTTILITSHVLAELEEIADHVLFLDEGRAAWQGGVEELKRTTGTATLERAVAALLGSPQGAGVA